MAPTPRSALFPYTTLFRSLHLGGPGCLRRPRFAGAIRAAVIGGFSNRCAVSDVSRVGFAGRCPMAATGGAECLAQCRRLAVCARRTFIQWQLICTGSWRSPLARTGYAPRRTVLFTRLDGVRSEERRVGKEGRDRWGWSY